MHILFYRAAMEDLFGSLYIATKAVYFSAWEIFQLGG